MLADNLAQQVASWTVSHLYAAVQDAANRAKAEKSALDTNTHRIAALFTQARSITNGPTREQALAKLAPLSKQQAQLIIDYRNFVAKFKGAVDTASKWLRSVGLSPPEVSLGAVPLLVPIAVGVAVAGVVAYVAVLHSKNTTIAKSVDAHARAFDALLAGQLTFAQYQDVAKNINDTTKDAANAADKGSLADTIGALVPVGLIVLAIMVGPQLLASFGPKRRAA